MGIHGPSQILGAGGAEFSRGHEDDIWNVGQFWESAWLKRIAGRSLDAVGSQAVAKSVVRKSRARHDTLANVRCCGGPAGAARQTGSHFSAHAKDEQIAIELRDRSGVGVGWTGKKLLQSGFGGNSHV